MGTIILTGMFLAVLLAAVVSKNKFYWLINAAVSVAFYLLGEPFLISFTKTGWLWFAAYGLVMFAIYRNPKSEQSAT